MDSGLNAERETTPEKQDSNCCPSSLPTQPALGGPGVSWRSDGGVTPTVIAEIELPCSRDKHPPSASGLQALAQRTQIVELRFAALGFGEEALHRVVGLEHTGLPSGNVGKGIFHRMVPAVVDRFLGPVNSQR